MWDGLKKFAGSVASDFLTDEQKAKAAGFARRAAETARAAADQAGAAARVAGEKAAEEHRKWQAARAAAEEARAAALAAEAGRERELAGEHGIRADLTYEIKQMFGLPMPAHESNQRKTAVEDRPPGGFFAPFGRQMPVPGWLHAGHPFFTGALTYRLIETGTLNNGSRGQVVWEVQPSFTVNASTWFYESLLIRALFERWKRGLPIVGGDNALLFPSISEDGYPIIDTSEDEDGTVRALVAEPDNVLCDAGDLEAFEKVLGRYRWTPWKGKYRKVQTTPVGAGFRKTYPLSGYSVGRPRVVSRVLVRGDPNRNPYAPHSTVHGSAQWAWKDELAARRMIDLDRPETITGHSFLGRSVYPPAAARLNHLTCFSGEGHRLIVGPPGSGKFTTAIAPLLLWSGDGDSAFIFDVKNGEAAKVTAAHRAELGPVTVLDPFGITGLESGAINPIDMLREDGPRLVANAERLAEAMFLPSNSQDQHWDQAAKKTLAALLMHVGTSEIYEDGERNLRTLRDIVREQIPDEVLAAMRANPAGDGEVAAEAKALIAAAESEASRYRFSVVQSLNVNIGFLKVPEILAATAETSFDPRQLKQRVSTLYVVTPDHQLGTVNRWVRLVYAYVMEQLRESGGDAPAGVSGDGANPDKPAHRPAVHVILDEFPALGKFERVAQDMAQTRSLGVHMHVVVQTFQQLQEIYGRGWESFQGTSAITHVLGARDNFTAEQISKMLGRATVKTAGQSQSHGTTGGSQSQSTNTTGRPLMTADELMAMPQSQAIAVVGGMNPVKLEKVAYFG
ncbi:MAG TPA: type IV secretory system conjugative DNA transfer family protein [Allosphingosinicella sp.]|jgi:type IV secretion system protein VirD4